MALPDASELRRQAAERVAAHRIRRMGDGAIANAAPVAVPRNKRSAQIAAAVAERYAGTQSYHDFLAAEAERVVQQARAAADVAELSAQALAAAQQDLLDAIEREDTGSGEPSELEPIPSVSHIEAAPSATPLLWQEHEAEANAETNSRRFQPPQPRRKQTRRSAAAESSEAREEAAAAIPAPGTVDRLQPLAGEITIRLYQDESGATRVTLDPPAASPIPVRAAAQDFAESEEEALLLDEEIAFRQEPAFEEPSGPAEPLPANLIEFPRQLVATRKARPRLAEGPLRDEVDAAPGAGQLRIFEVEPEQIAVAPPAEAEVEAEHIAQWSSILLDSRPRAGAYAAVASEAPVQEAAQAQATARTLVGIASIQRRMLAAAVNAGIVGAAFAVFAVVFVWTAGHVPSGAHSFTGRAAIVAALPFAACAVLLLAAIYQALFYTLSTATPGMRVARIALCTFSDENPTRAAVRKRLPMLLLSALPMGFGFLWSLLDEERLTWHDRICGIYLRSY